MICVLPGCGGHTTVKDSRPAGAARIRRRRSCDRCRHRFTTFEVLGVDHNPELRALRSLLEIAVAQVAEHARAIISLVPDAEPER